MRLIVGQKKWGSCSRQSPRSPSHDFHVSLGVLITRSDIACRSELIHTDFLQICLRNVFIPTHRHIALMRTVDDLLRYGYFSQRGRHVIEVKSDTGADGATIQCLSESELYVERGVQKYPEYKDHSDEAFCSTTPSVCLIGWSGIGKTSSINHHVDRQFGP